MVPQNDLLQSFLSTSIYRIGLQKLSIMVAISAIFSYICTAHAQKLLIRNFRKFRCKFRHRRSIRRRRFPIRVQNFRAWAMFFCWFLHFMCWMSAIFQLPVCLTYWPRKNTTRVDLHVDNSHQVWSWYDHPLPSYSVLSADMLCDLANLTFWLLDLEQLPCTAGHLVWRPYEYDYSSTSYEL